MSRCRFGLRRNKNRKLRGHRNRRGGGRSVFPEEISLNGLLPSPGPVTRTVESDDRCGAARVAGVTPRGAGFADAPLIGPTARSECAGWEFAGGSAISSVEPLRSGLASGLSESVRNRVVIAEDGPIGPTWVAESSGGAWRDCTDGLSERDSSVAVAGGFTAGVLKVFAADGLEVREVVSSGRLDGAGDVVSTANIDF